jgi:hypothetical protein
MEDVMRGHAHHPRTHSSRHTGAGRQLSPPPSLLGWNGPTLSEFVEQIEHEFGTQVDLSSLRLSGLAGNEALEPADIRSLCELLGLPAEDFGVA